jgi:hypothetical protein
LSFELHHSKHIEDELTKIVRQQLRNAAHALITSSGSQLRSAVHESRKSAKKARAVAAFLAEADAALPRRDRKGLKSAARAVSSVRDSAAIQSTCRADGQPLRRRSFALGRRLHVRTPEAFAQ